MPRIAIEIVPFEDGAQVNFWDHFEGQDLCYELDEEGTLRDEEGHETTFGAFIEEVRKIVKSRAPLPGETNF